MLKKPVIYVAGPFRAPGAFGIAKNVMAAAEVALSIWKAGAVALCPHMNTFCFQGEAPDETWLEGDMELLRRCDAIFVLPNFSRSSGTTAEALQAVAWGIPRLYSLWDLNVFLARWKERA